MFFFYASSWLAERTADWLIVQGGYYMAAIAMRSSPIIPFRRDHQESPPPAHPFPPSPIPALPSLHSLFLRALSSCPPLHTHMQRRVNRAPPALSEQMGAAKDSRLVFPSLFLTLFHSHFFLSFSLPIRTSANSQQTSIFHTFVFAKNGRWGRLCGKTNLRTGKGKFPG